MRRWALVLAAAASACWVARGTGAPPAGKVELKLKLPPPVFEGTKKPLKGVRLRPGWKPDTKRPPFFMPKGAMLLSRGKPVTGSSEPIMGELEQVTDGDNAASEGSYIELEPGRQFVQIDLQRTCKLYCVVLWNWHKNATVYRDVVVQVASDPDFILDVKTLFNNDHDNSSGLGVGKDYEFVGTCQGELMPVDGTEGRYVRFYSNGNANGDMNHYTEVEVYGVPAK